MDKPKKPANPLYLRPYTEGVQTHTSATNDPKRAPRKFAPKAPTSPRNRPESLKKAADDVDHDDAMAIFERMDEAAQVTSSSQPKGKGKGRGFSSYSGATSSRMRFQPQKAYLQSRGPAYEKKGAGISKNLADVSNVEDGRYRPITVPFYASQGEGPSSAPQKEKKASTMFHANGKWIEDQLILMQAPIIVPDPVDIRDEAMSTSAGGFHKIPDGKIGKLRVHKSGKVSLVIGGVAFDVSTGCDLQCYQEVCCVSPEQNVCMFMGPAPAKAVITPNISAFLAPNKEQDHS